MKHFNLLALVLILFCACGLGGENKVGPVGQKKIVGLESFKLFHVDSSCELHEKPSGQDLALRQLILKVPYKWEYSGTHVGDDDLRKLTNPTVANKKSLIADRDLILGGENFKAGESLNKMIHWQGGPNTIGFRLKKETILDSDLANEPSNFTLKVNTNDGVEHTQNINLVFDSTLVVQNLEPKGIPCEIKEDM